MNARHSADDMPTDDMQTNGFNELSSRGGSQSRTRNLEIPGLLLRTIPE